MVDNLSTGTRQNLEHLRALDGDLELIEADLNDADAARRACAGVEIAFHLAALPSVARSVEFPITSNAANVTATLELLCAARAAGVRRIVYAASSSAYGDRFATRRRGDATASIVKRETMPPRPLSPYAVSKLAGEYYTQVFHDVYGVETVCLRYFNIFGPRQNPFSRLRRGDPQVHHRVLRGERAGGLRRRPAVARLHLRRQRRAREPARRRGAEEAGLGRGLQRRVRPNATLLDVIERREPAARQDDRAEVRAGPPGRRSPLQGGHLEGEASARLPASVSLVEGSSAPSRGCAIGCRRLDSHRRHSVSATLRTRVVKRDDQA